MQMTQRAQRTGCAVFSAIHGTTRTVKRIMASVMKMVRSAKTAFEGNAAKDITGLTGNIFAPSFVLVCVKDVYSLDFNKMFDKY